MTLRLDSISKKVGLETHIYDTTLELQSGGFNVLLGRTLAGKTTLMRLMAGLDKPSSGRVIMNGEDITDKPVQKRNVAMVYQQFINYPSMTVYKNIASPLKIAGLSRVDVDRKVREAAELVHIEQYLDRLPAELSGGQQQRCAMARALVKDASLLLFDEPLVNLDYKLREELRYEMREVFKRSKAIAVYASTDPVEALSLGGHTAIVDAGKILQFGPTSEVFHNPATVEVGKVFSDPPINLLQAHKTEQALHIGHDVSVPLAGHLQNLPNGHYQFGIRANHLFARRRSTVDVEIDCVVELAEIGGSETFIHVQHDQVGMVVQQEGVHEFRIGEALKVYVDPRHFYAFDAAGKLVAAPDRSSYSHRV